MAGDVADFDSPFDAISQLSELLKQDDSDWLALDIGTLVKKYPDVSQEQGGIIRWTTNVVRFLKQKQSTAYSLNT